jgi:hypothetical protein
MFENREILVRELNAREIYRYKRYQILPVDAISFTSTIEKVIERFHPKKLYRYGCELDDTFISIEDNNEVNEGKNMIFHLRGFSSFDNFPFSSNFSFQSLTFRYLFFYRFSQKLAISNISQIHSNFQNYQEYQEY